MLLIPSRLPLANLLLARQGWLTEEPMSCCAQPVRDAKWLRDYRYESRHAMSTRGFTRNDNSCTKLCDCCRKSGIFNSSSSIRTSFVPYKYAARIRLNVMHRVQAMRRSQASVRPCNRQQRAANLRADVDQLIRALRACEHHCRRGVLPKRASTTHD